MADALSRCFEPPAAELQLLSAPQFLFIDELRQDLAQDSTHQALYQQVISDPASFLEFSISNGLLLKKGRI